MIICRIYIILNERLRMLRIVLVLVIFNGQRPKPQNISTSDAIWPFLGPDFTNLALSKGAWP